MELDKHISDLLYRYDCVIVPNFGGFITNRLSAKLNSATHTFYPPSKQVSFNSHLNVNDGLLVNYIASVENVSYNEANQKINIAVSNWKNTLETSELNLSLIGSLKLNTAKKIIFEPAKKVNYLAESFGLESVTAKISSPKETVVKQLIPETNNTEKKGIPTFIKYAATAAILLTLGFAGYNGYQQNKQKEILAQQEKELEKKIQAATFIISNPLPTIELNVAKEKPKLYHVVAGAFQFPENAEKKVNQLKQKGYNASILGVNKWGLTEVAFASFSEKNDAINTLYKIQKTISKEAWLLVKK